MAILNPLADAQITFVLGFVNILGVLLLISTCRCAPVRLPQKIIKLNAYQWLLRHHCWYWWIFLLSVVVHAVFAMTAFGNPFS